jgi:hypothetical protein
MISTNETLRDPTLLEQRFLCAGEVALFGKFAEGAPPEVVEVLPRPALRDEVHESTSYWRRTR